jgi:hypothetical protein
MNDKEFGLYEVLCKNGKRYVGEYVNDDINGIGSFTDDENVMIGRWKESKRDGENFHYLFASGTVYIGGYI